MFELDPLSFYYYTVYCMFYCREGSTGDIYRDLRNQQQQQNPLGQQSVDFDDVDGRAVDLVLGGDAVSAQEIKVKRPYKPDMEN